MNKPDERIENFPIEKARIVGKRYMKFRKGINPLIDQLREHFCHYCLIQALFLIFTFYKQVVHYNIVNGIGSGAIFIPRESIMRIPQFTHPQPSCMNNLLVMQEAYYRVLSYCSKIHAKLDSFDEISGLLDQYISEFRTQKPPGFEIISHVP